MGGVEFKLCGKSFVAVEQTGPKGNPMWRYPQINDEQHREIEALASELPESILIDGKDHQFGTVKKKNGGTKPFAKAREVRANTEVANAPVSIHCRVTTRRNGKWYFWLHIDPRVTATQENKTRPEGHKTTGSSGETDQLDSILEIFDEE